MAPQTLGKDESSKKWTGSHEENCRRVKARLLELNPGYNVFIYWVSWGSIQPDGLRPKEWAAGTFNSKPSNAWYAWTYQYYVFAEGILTWNGSTAADKISFTDNNYEKAGSEFRFQRTTRPKVQWTDWMGQLRAKLGARSSQLYLSSLALPATHDSHALASNVGYTGWSSILNFPGLHGTSATFAECQTQTIKEQLDMGVRCLDFRLGPGLKLRHGLVELTGHLEDVVKVMNEWLDSHDQETIFFQAKWDMEPYNDENKNKTVAEVDQLLKRFPRALAHLSEVPKLSDCVGKMVLYNDNNHGPWYPNSWDGPSFKPTRSGDIEIHCEGVFHRLQSILPKLDVGDKKFYDVWCSSETLSQLKIFGDEGNRLKTFKWNVARPVAFADRLKHKSQLLWWLAEHRGGNQNQGHKARLGRVNMDFVDHKWASEIVLWNFDDSFL